ncbi:MAG: WS/DGAT domain-containing protein, partial [Casimicrobium sp.]
PTDYPGLLAPLLVSRINATVANTKLLEKLPPVANLVISNVPGPQVPLFLAGAQMRTFFPVSIIVHGIALNITVQTYCGSVDFGVVACKKAVPDLHKLTDAVNSAFDELVALAEAKVALDAEAQLAAEKPVIKAKARKSATKTAKKPRASPRK